MKPGVVVVGSVALDTVETVHGKHADALGGAAVYFSLAARHFSKPGMIGVVGGDFPERHVSMLRKRGIDTEGLQRVRGESFRWAGRYSPDGNTAHTLETRLGVFAQFSPRVPDTYRSAGVLFLANIDPELQYHVLRQMRGALSGGDTMNFWIKSKRPQLLRMLRRLHILFVNDQEARMLTGEHSLLKASLGLLRLGPRVAVVKKGEHGSMIRSRAGVQFCPPFPVRDVRDPTGAGDSFAGAFMSVLAKSGRRSRNLDEKILARACAFGSVVSSFTVESFGVAGLVRLKPAAIRGRYEKLKTLVAI
ncbi:MAG: hypothetical protein A3G34_06250 [Candidatus Lindowbacteria bacterium RIFCSPLOWO2_12_FULL_62_27]|nr:MAG: hypothetical protein A3G34_06250 [Candidatus Lindowbacteria bacterium RIFCSPLOWO2_12_FULL_62_27]OGH58767.1 MAG: hypothetical protein A3I06_09635 [Candidatus Lindowbacteria bacterium RIFCSPLOWO2_02_FULL_62_12]